MSVLISGVLIDPSGTAISDAEITFTALTNSSVLNGFSVSATTNEDGEYAIPLELCDYSISIQHDGNNAIYGSVSINKDTTPTTINDLLEKARQEQTVTPQIIVYFREIQADVTQKLGTMQSLNIDAKSAADSAATSNGLAQEQAQKAQQASVLSQQASASALISANSAAASKAAAETAATNALNSANAAGTAKRSAESAASQAEQSKLAAVSAAGSAENAKEAAENALRDATVSKNEAAQYAQTASAATAQAQQASASAGNAANVASTAAEKATETLYQQQLLAGEGSVTLTTPQTISAQKIFSSPLYQRRSSYPGLVLESTDIASNVVGRKVFCEVDNTGLAIFFIARNENDAAGQRFAKLSLPAASEPGDIVLTSGVQTLTGYKVFSVTPRTLNGISIAGTTTAGESRDMVKIAGDNFLHLGDSNINAVLHTLDAVPAVRVGSAAPANILVQGRNAVVDANGFYKTASPVVKLFSDGTSELTDEAQGIYTERISEGVYRISGCLGLNADRAWGGDDGGIDVPMCRNKLPRLWVDFGGDDGSQINEDGSIIIRTYHRPHPDAPAFARNELDGYANGDPIDIPRDAFILVRVQMPERGEQKPKVMLHSNVYCSNISYI
ncbi:hypothetical protein Dpoa2040_000745 [Dickeya sp. CFBP 2040]|uniref:phage tail fiber protein n=1 Tax=Dickeya sp. CFBP 2040 TaxID=2718531 RepID=UPI001444C59B|nr:prophage tail fiber N-terminal domain-containing protein [Dickeya sp. CFBP 2040]NKI73543.1 hypothetical protein [Dickeya sp. CFBP 2040]